MEQHAKLGNTNQEQSKALRSLIHQGIVTLGGYKKAKIYGLLNCPAGKRMNTENRVFFRDEQEAVAHGYRPCGTCLPAKYKKWKTII